MLSMYTVIVPHAIYSRNIMFIMVWKVAGELVRPKNMTVGSYSPSGVVNAAFQQSSFFILTVLYPHQMSTVVKRVHPQRWLICCGIRGRGYWFFIVHLLTGL